VSSDETEFKVGDRVRTPDGDGEILSFQDGVIEVGIKGENDWFYDAEDIKSLSGAAPGEKTFVETVTDFSTAVSHEDTEEIIRLGKQLGIEEPEPPLAPWERELLWTPFEQNVRRITDQIADLLIAKNKAYGDAALNPIRVFSKSDRIEQLNVRIDDKISRIQRGTDFEDEDTVRDLAGYLVLRLIAEESE
jgi:hypothetical protein